MKEHDTVSGNSYFVTCKAGCTITDASGELELTCEPGHQQFVNAPSDKLYTSKDAVVRKANFNYALAALGLLGGGVPKWFTELKKELDVLVGAGNYELTLDNDNQTLRLGLSTSGWEKVETVNDLLSRVLPKHLVVEYETVPIDYIPLEYLQSSGTQGIILSDIASDVTGAKARLSILRYYSEPLFGRNLNNTRWFLPFPRTENVVRWGWLGNHEFTKEIEVGQPYTTAYNWKNDKKVILDDSQVGTLSNTTFDSGNLSMFAYDYTAAVSFSAGRIFSLSLSQGEKVVRDFIPALDPLGVPCMFDRVTRTPFYNDYSGTFGYALKEETVPASGVYARLKNGELDIIADTEDVAAMPMTLDLWEEVTPFMHFANVGEAMDHYGIVPKAENEL